MVHGDDGHDLVLLVDLVDDSEIPAASAALAIELEPELEPELATEPLGVLGQRAEDELDASGRRLLRKTVESTER